MNSDLGRFNTMPRLYFFPFVMLGMMIGQILGYPHEHIYGPWLRFTDIVTAIGIMLGGACGFMLWRWVPAFQRRWLILIVLPAYILVGFRLGHIFGDSPDAKNLGAIIGVVIGAVIGFVAGRSIASPLEKAA